jgi:hypothetical protein
MVCTKCGNKTQPTISNSSTGSAQFQQHQNASCHKVLFSLYGKMLKEFHFILIETVGEHPPSNAIVKNWVAQFIRGDFFTCDAPCPAQTKAVTVLEFIHQILMHSSKTTGRISGK